MKHLIEASENLLDRGSKNTGIELPPMVHRYTVNVLTKYFDHFPNFNQPPFGIRLMEAETVSDYVDLAEDSLMYSSIFKGFTANRLGKGGVRYVLDVSYTSYGMAGMTEISTNLTKITEVLGAITGNTDFGELIMLARAGDETSTKRLEELGVYLIR